MIGNKHTAGCNRLLYLIPIFVMSLDACTDVDSFSTIAEYEKKASVTIEFDWTGTGLEQGGRPDSLTLVFDSLTDSCKKQCVKVGLDGKVPDGTLFQNGEWICTVINEKVQGMTLYGFDDFRTKDSCSMKAITARADTLSYSELSKIRGDIDTNPGIPYFKEIQNNVSGFGRVRINGVSNNTFTVKMKDLAVKVSFNIKVKIEDDVKIERMLGEISGVPGIISLMDKEVETSSMGMTLFEIRPDGADSSRWNGSANIAGVIPSKSSDLIIGDGILNLRIYVRNEGKREIFVATMNLKSMLDEKPVLVPTDRSGIYHCSESGSYVFDIPSTLWLTPAGIRSGNDGLGIEEWVNREKLGREL